MCGIAGWVSFDDDAHRDVISKMTETMALRGPDAGGVWIDRHVGLGHRRLAIIDLAGGVQPMQVEDDAGRTIASLIYTGEVYNFVELRDQLSRLGHRFKSQSDTEFVLRGYMKWGDGVVERLNGMFAFAIWDVRSEELFLVRDRMGVKPLFYYPPRRRAVRLRAESDPRASERGIAGEQRRVSRNPRARKESRNHDLCRHARGAAGTGRAREPRRAVEATLLDAQRACA